MTEERYVIVADDCGQVIYGDHERADPATRTFRVFSNRHVAESHSRRRMDGRYLKLQEVPRNEFRRILGSARDRGYAYVDLDGHEIGLNQFAKLVEQEHLE